MLTNKRVGKFEIELSLIEANPEIVAAVFKNGVIPVRAECLIHKGCIEYVAICYQFDEVEPVTIPPTYDITAEQGEGDEIVVKFVKPSAGE